MHVLICDLFCWLCEEFPWWRFCLLHLVFFCGVGVLQMSRVSSEGTVFTLNILCHLSVTAASVHFSLSLREMIAGVLCGKMLQEFLFLALNPPGLLDLACIPHPSSLTPGAALPLWP